MSLKVICEFGDFEPWGGAVDFRRKIFMTFENPRYDYVNSNSLEVVRKQDIRDYIHFLKREGFEEVDEF